MRGVVVMLLTTTPVFYEKHRRGGANINEFNEDKAVSRLTELLALEYGVKPDTARKIRAAALLHDIGKQRIPESILNKPGKLSEQEFGIMKVHTILGAEMLSSIQGEMGEMARDCCLYHHEHWDGGGYWGKLSDSLPIYIQFVSIADVFTALICDRPYKEAWPPNKAIGYIQSQAGKQFSPALAEAFLSLVKGDSRVREIFLGRDDGICLL